MENCLLFRLLRLRWMACPVCRRDVLWRRRNPHPTRCRWCGSLLIDFAAMGRSVMALAAAAAMMAAAAQQAAQATKQVTDVFRQPPPPGWNPLDSAMRLRRLPSDPQPQEND